MQNYPAKFQVVKVGLILLAILLIDVALFYLLQQGLITEQVFDYSLLGEYIVVSIPVVYYIRNFTLRSRIILSAILIVLTVGVYWLVPSIFVITALVSLVSIVTLITKEWFII